jgi:hypothetical protein
VPDPRADAVLQSRLAYIAALRRLSDEDLLLEFRDRDSMPDFRAELEAEVQHRKELRAKSKAADP